MSQQINLYQPLFRQQKKIFSAVTLVQIVALIAVGLGAIYGFTRVQVKRIEREVASLDAQQVQAQAQLATLTGMLAARKKDDGLKNQISRAEDDIRGRKQLLTWLGSNQQARSDGFSDYLAGLARQHESELWLDGITLAEGGQQVSLHGGSHEPAAVIRFLRRLGAESAYAGLEFRSVSINQVPDKPGELAFSVSTREAKADPAVQP